MADALEDLELLEERETVVLPGGGPVEAGEDDDDFYLPGRPAGGGRRRVILLLVGVLLLLGACLLGVAGWRTLRARSAGQAEEQATTTPTAPAAATATAVPTPLPTSWPTLVPTTVPAPPPAAWSGQVEGDALAGNGMPVLFSMYLRNAGGPAPVTVTLELPYGLHYWRGDFALEGDSARRLVWRGAPQGEERLSAVLWPEPGADVGPRLLTLALDGVTVLGLELRPDGPVMAEFGTGAE